jgi:hypothetical protein
MLIFIKQFLTKKFYTVINKFQGNYLMKNFKKFLPIALIIGFILFGLDAFLQSKPSTKNKRIYKAVQEYSPYYLDKRFGGLQIMSKEDPEFKETPNNMTLFKEFEHLEQKWGKKHLKIENSQLIISDNNGSVLSTLFLQTKEELDFAHNYYGI